MLLIILKAFMKANNKTKIKYLKSLINDIKQNLVAKFVFIG